ncbi:unnamed protein product, partial [Mesorhabditis belari]|uniref:Uncharacterized protein n=1 Tax=Mesorhabditis belari TaxID=2138241 RepID=A0AAF3F8F3_9BILA
MVNSAVVPACDSSCPSVVVACCVSAAIRSVIVQFRYFISRWDKDLESGGIGQQVNWCLAFTIHRTESGQTIDRIPFIGHRDNSNNSSHRHPFICQCTARNIFCVCASCNYIRQLQKDRDGILSSAAFGRRCTLDYSGAIRFLALTSSDTRNASALLLSRSSLRRSSRLHFFCHGQRFAVPACDSSCPSGVVACCVSKDFNGGSCIGGAAFCN